MQARSATQVKVTKGTTQVGLTTIPAGLTRSQPDVALLNLPVTTTTTSPFTPQTTTFKLLVSKTGYTASFRKFNDITVTVLAPPDTWNNLGKYYTDPYSRVSLRPNTNFQAVVDWTQPAAEDADPQNLDAFLFLPEAVNSNKGAIIGPPDFDPVLLDPLDPKKYMGGSTLLIPAKFGGTFSPYAQYQFNGGIQTGTDACGNPVYTDPLEAITIASSATRSSTPFLVPKYTQSQYTFFVHAENPANFSADANPLKPVVRLWARGKWLKTYLLTDLDSCDGSNDWWQVFTINNTAVSGVGTTAAASQCGISPTVWPYSTP